MKKLHSQSGFTLVELAVVMIIIGLLIGGVLKGQELIRNAQIAATVAQVKAIDAATSTFRDMYNGLPGDLLNAGTRLSNCTGLCAPAATVADGDGILSTAPNVAPAADAQAYFLQLSVADLITGINTGATACTAWGQCFPEARTGSGSGIQIGFWGGGAGLSPAGNAPRGHYVTIQTGAGGQPGSTAGAEALTPNQAFRIDSRIDDGQPTSGSVVSGGNAACINAATPAAYAETSTSSDCNLFIRIQG